MRKKRVPVVSTEIC